MTEDPWIRAIPEKYIPGHIIKGKVAKLTNFGAFVELEPELEGLLHISELADHKIDKPQDVVKVGDEVEVKILKVDTDARKIGLSLRRVKWAEEEQAAETGQQRAPSGPEKVLSDAAVAQLKKQKAAPGKSKPTDSEPDKSESRRDQKPEVSAADESRTNQTEEPGQPELKTPKQTDQAVSEESRESTDTDSQTGGDTAESGVESDKTE
jgi:predicted RNA-binding protein with RPS1 domain